jgi:hypothetical protein
VKNYFYPFLRAVAVREEERFNADAFRLLLPLAAVAFTAVRRPLPLVDTFAFGSVFAFVFGFGFAFTLDGRARRGLVACVGIIRLLICNEAGWALHHERLLVRLPCRTCILEYTPNLLLLSECPRITRGPLKQTQNIMRTRQGVIGSTKKLSD